jgi:transposase-like protein/IS1 family transposase
MILTHVKNLISTLENTKRFVYTEGMKTEAKAKYIMNCPDCDTRCASFGKHRNGLRRFRCGDCGKTYTEPHEKPLGEMTVPMEKAVLALKMLLEGASVRSVERTVEIHRDTILRLLVLAGEKCERIMAKHIRNVPVQDVEVDEAWSWISKKQKRVQPEDDQNFGDCYVFVAIERTSKLIINFAMGKRDRLTTNAFIEGLRDAVAPGRFQITSDGFAPYRTSIPDTFGNRVDFAMLIKVYKASQEGEARYSPAEVESVEVVPVCGNPDPDRICTSIIERSNLSLRMGCRRFTRLTNAFSKKWENHWAAVTLWYTYYNFCRVHNSLRVTPAMAHEITDHVWPLAELLA